MTIFTCPYRSCQKKFDTLNALKYHFRFAHHDAWEECPICKRKYKRVTKHAYDQFVSGDDLHGVLYYLLSSRKKYDLNTFDKAYRVAYKYLTKGGGLW